MVSPNHFNINNKNISDIKRKQLKANAIETDKKDMRQITLMEKLKHENLALKILYGTT